MRLDLGCGAGYVWLCVVICGSPLLSCNDVSSDTTESAAFALEEEGVDETGDLPGQEAASAALSTNQALRTLNLLYAAEANAEAEADGASGAVDGTIDDEPGALGVTRDARGNVRLLHAGTRGIPIELAGESESDKALAFLKEWASLYRQDGTLEMGEVERNFTVPGTVRLTQTHLGLPVFGSDVLVHVDPLTGRVLSIAGGIVPASLMPAVDAKLTAIDAEAYAYDAGLLGYGAKPVLGILDPVLMTNAAGQPAMAWRVEGTDYEGMPYATFVDASTGGELLRQPLFSNIEWKNLYAGGVQLCGPTNCVCSNYQQGTIEDTCELATDIWTYYSTSFGRDGWDNASPLSPAHQMVVAPDWNLIGTQNGLNVGNWIGIGSQAACPDIIGHEYTHAVQNWEFHVDDEYTGLSLPSLNEAFSDVIGNFSSQFAGNADWQILSGSPQCTTLMRDMADPESQAYGSLFYPGHWSNYFLLHPDTHYNATIIDKSAHLLGRASADGAATHWGRSVTGIGRPAAEDIYYTALTEYLTKDATHTDVRLAMIDAAAVLFRYFPAIRSATNAAFDAIGLWTPDYEVDIDGIVQSTNAVRYQPFVVNGSNRYYLVYTDTSNNVRMKYNDAPFYTAGWSAAVTLGSSNKSPAVGVFGTDMYIIWKNSANNFISWRKLSAAGVLSATVQTAFQTDSDLAAAATPGSIYFVWKPVGAGEVLLKGAYWSNNSWAEMGQFPAGTASLYGAGIAADSNYNLWFSYVKSNGVQPTVYVKALGFSLFWQPEVAIPDSNTNVQPSLLFYRDRVNVAASRTFSADVQQIWHASCAYPCTATDDLTRWVMQDGVTGYYVTLAKVGAESTRMYMLHSSKYGSSTIEWRSKDSE